MKFLQGTKLYSIFKGTCPVCQKESMYKESNPYKITRIFDMYERCSYCQTKYKMEPSFFFGAMYVSYALGVAVSVGAFIIAYVFIGGGLMTTFFAITLTLIVLMPIILRLSRNIWINMFLSYKEAA
ncbi:uncharacterized protein DUF983 [Gillisia sp. Hel_I_86]|uniref:DUF983 domain-containing protein n=1 Tax=Gillisia sp. Hel_I_86 TaxID=1249981 RepID=UPI0011994D4D|nr:DUF983 domain-containing protein [Gillisia sp. Hel_I_86]TVZ27048.1 uncharacterized protein DUF983 [Gillisia sp. Hel_I_86]